MTVTFRKVAARDLSQAKVWYDGRRPGLGREFLTAVSVAVEQIRLFPLAAPVVAGPNRRVLLSRFPYAVYYQVLPPTILVTAVLHMHRDPDTIHQRRQ